MGIESGDFSLDTEAWIGASSEKVSEKAREQASSKVLAGIARARKDESKGKKASGILSSVLISLLRDPRFDPLLEPIMTLLRLNLPAAYIVGLLSLISKEASSIIRKTYDPSLPRVPKDPPPESDRKEFNPNQLREDFRNRINEWISDIFLVATKDPSYILSEKFLSEIASSKTRVAFIECCEAVMVFFFDTKNVRVLPEDARSLSVFLLKELESRIRSTDRWIEP